MKAKKHGFDNLLSSMPTEEAIPGLKSICIARTKKEPCRWPRCECAVDIVYTTAYKNGGLRKP